jgi:hypothetical protein
VLNRSRSDLGRGAAAPPLRDGGAIVYWLKVGGDGESEVVL